MRGLVARWTRSASGQEPYPRKRSARWPARARRPCKSQRRVCRASLPRPPMGAAIILQWANSKRTLGRSEPFALLSRSPGAFLRVICSYTASRGAWNESTSERDNAHGKSSPRVERSESTEGLHSTSLWIVGQVALHCRKSAPNIKGLEDGDQCLATKSTCELFWRRSLVKPSVLPTSCRMSLPVETAKSKFWRITFATARAHLQKSHLRQNSTGEILASR